MVIIIAGASHTGKTVLAQKLLEKYKFPYLSIDHLKMGLIRSGQTKLTPLDDDKLTPYLWEIVREMIKTAVENKQNLIVEGAYVPFDWKKDFTSDYLREIHYYCLVMTEEYIMRNFSAIKAHADDIEARLDDSWISEKELAAQNVKNLEMCRKYGCNYVLIDENYCPENAVINDIKIKSRL